jgi:hypothetical protein
MLLFFTASRPVLGPTQPPIQWVLGVLSPGVRWLGHGADHSPLPSAEFKNDRNIPPFPHASSWRSAYLVKHRGFFTCTCIVPPPSVWCACFSQLYKEAPETITNCFCSIKHNCCLTFKVGNVNHYRFNTVDL